MERKCPMFRGRVGMGIEEWVEEVNASIRTRHLGTLDQAYFIFDHLDGEAKDEIRYRTRAEREDPTKVLAILKELYGCSKSYVALQEDFFSRRQLDGESLHNFSHALLSLMNEVTQSSPVAVPNPDVLLRDTFVEHLLDFELRRELKRLVRQTPGLSMLEVRAEAVQWEREGRPCDFARGRSCSAPSLCAMQSSRAQQNSHPPQKNPVKSEMTELRALLLAQQEQINQLINSWAILQVPVRQARPGRSPSVVCRRCQRPGHYARDCDNDRAVPVQQTAALRRKERHDQRVHSQVQRTMLKPVPRSHWPDLPAAPPEPPERHDQRVHRQVQRTMLKPVPRSHWPDPPAAPPVAEPESTEKAKAGQSVIVGPPDASMQPAPPNLARSPAAASGSVKPHEQIELPFLTLALPVLTDPGPGGGVLPPGRMSRVTAGRRGTPHHLPVSESRTTAIWATNSQVPDSSKRTIAVFRPWG
ncbi:uncharacterized protein LOC116223806 [Clupea harengus]|uniref:Uncharacterized protein LOC116223806 n=1 Tax=Clupea harengus TaxID=7950 RepID=A0A6P8GQK3_CLUHA|nr:uncharacterized protein LOC116223806 [Clupea harengus]